MKKLNSENLIRGYANLLLTVLVLVVFSVAFLPIGTPTASSIAPSPYYRGNADKKQVSLMFNVYSGTEYVLDILSTLEEYEAKYSSLLDALSSYGQASLVEEKEELERF